MSDIPYECSEAMESLISEAFAAGDHYRPRSSELQAARAEMVRAITATLTAERQRAERVRVAAHLLASSVRKEADMGYLGKEPHVYGCRIYEQAIAVLALTSPAPPAGVAAGDEPRLTCSECNTTWSAANTKPGDLCGVRISGSYWCDGKLAAPTAAGDGGE